MLRSGPIAAIARPERESGFTLLEILVGLVLLSIMMSLLFGSIRMGARVWDAGEQRAAELDRMLIVQSFLRRHLATARPVFDDFSDDEPVFSFTGTENSIQFVSDLPSSARRGGLHRFNLELEKDGGAFILYAKLTAFYPTLDGVDAEIEDVRLLSGVERIAFSYYGVDEFDVDASDASWMDEWTDKEFMPYLIQLDIRMQDGRAWPTMIVEPKLATAVQTTVGIPVQ